MKIWFDLSNSPHINMFGGMIRELEKEHEIVITCRPLANTIDLLDLHGFRYTVVGRHYGADMRDKLLGFGVRVRQLQQFLGPKHIDVAVSQSSFHSPVVAKLLGMRCIYLNDNEHAMGNIPAFLCANQIMVPEFLSIARLKRQYARERKVTHFPGIKEGIYLWQNAGKLLAKKQERPPPRRPSIYLRPEPWSAQYYRGALNFMDDLVVGLSRSADLTILPRGQAQFAHYTQARFDGVRVISSALDIADIVPDCDLFIGAGGTMTREMAVLGIPTISVYQAPLLAVDQYLLARHALIHRPNLTADVALRYLEGCNSAPRADLLEKGRHAYAMIRKAIVA